jgi:polysaccharide biosynthesis/export protein
MTNGKGHDVKLLARERENGMQRHLPRRMIAVGIGAGCLLWLGVRPAAAQGSALAAASARSDKGTPIAVPPDYVIGPEDQLSVVFFQDKDMSADVVVRPDGKISLPLINEIQAGGLTPEQLRESVSAQAKQFMQDPKTTIVIRQINSRKVYITGAVEKPGTYPLMGPTAVLQLIATAGGVKEYADTKNILIIRKEKGRQVTINFNYKDVISRKNMSQNIDLRPGDTIVVP